VPTAAAPFDVRAANLNHSDKWEDEALKPFEPFEPFVCEPEQMFRELQEYIKSQESQELQELQESQEGCFFGSPEYDFIESCNNQNVMPFCCD
jgi:hypothetical protein